MPSLADFGVDAAENGPQVCNCSFLFIAETEGVVDAERGGDADVACRESLAPEPGVRVSDAEVTPHRSGGHWRRRCLPLRHRLRPLLRRRRCLLRAAAKGTKHLDLIAAQTLFIITE